jgi:glycosyltransferase involved in cell wall biosynthesis
MRVALVSKTFVAETAQRQLEWLARRADIELTLFTPDAWRSDDGRLLHFVPRFTAGYAYRCLSVYCNGRYHLYLYRGLHRALAQVAPDLIHIDEEPYNPAGMQAQRSAVRLGVPTVFVAWQNRFRTYPPPFAQIERYNYARTAHIVAGSVAAAAVLRRKGYAGALSTFSLHGVDPEIYAPLSHRRGGDHFIVGYIGRLVHYKGVGLLIEALAGLPKHCRLHLVGSGADEAGLRRLAEERGVAERVAFVPAVPTTEIPSMLEGMDTLALPSLAQPNWEEQFGRVLIEAMACGVPVVGSDSGEIPHVIGAAGLVVPEGDVAALRAALLTLVSDPTRRVEYGQRGRERVLERFTQERVAQRMAAVYATVLGMVSAQPSLRPRARETTEVCEQS